jgi:hypothetical protein
VKRPWPSGAATEECGQVSLPQTTERLVSSRMVRQVNLTYPVAGREPQRAVGLLQLTAT